MDTFKVMLLLSYLTLLDFPRFLVLFSSTFLTLPFQGFRNLVNVVLTYLIKKAISFKLLTRNVNTMYDYLTDHCDGSLNSLWIYKALKLDYRAVHCKYTI